MNIHEYQAKGILREYNIPVGKGGVAYTVAEASQVAQTLSSSKFVVKAQIHAGGRGKGGGVKIANNLDQVADHASKIIGMNLKTPQTGAAGQKVLKVYVEEGCDIERELYLSLMVNRKDNTVSVIASAAGGMDIEEVAHSQPDKVLKVNISIAAGVQPFHVRLLAKIFDLKGPLTNQLSSLINNLYRAFIENDMSLLEINPLVVTKSQQIVALDAKISFDDNALFRHKKIEDLRDEAEEEEIERKARQYNLNYVKLDGNIGCLVNGAGLAMATMDIIQFYGEMPANFLDVGGGADRERVTNAFKLILSDKKVEAILVNIFGGIMRCDIIADGIVVAAKELGLSVPLVVRLEGTNVEIGKKILSSSGLSIIAADGMADAAQKVVQAVKGAK